jgi:hypothetical protein
MKLCHAPRPEPHAVPHTAPRRASGLQADRLARSKPGHATSRAVQQLARRAKPRHGVAQLLAQLRHARRLCHQARQPLCEEGQGRGTEAVGGPQCRQRSVNLGPWRVGWMADKATTLLGCGSARAVRVRCACDAERVRVQLTRRVLARRQQREPQHALHVGRVLPAATHGAASGRHQQQPAARRKPALPLAVPCY